MTTLLTTHAPPRHRPPPLPAVARVATVAWHHETHPAAPAEWTERDSMASDDYRSGHGIELSVLKSRLGPITLAQLSDTLHVGRTTVERWLTGQEAMHRDIVTRIRAIRTAQDTAITAAVEALDPDHPQVTLHRGPDHVYPTQVQVWAMVREPRTAAVLETGRDGTLFAARLILGQTLLGMADLIGVRKRTWQDWESGRDPMSVEVLARVTALIDKQDHLAELAAADAASDPDHQVSITRLPPDRATLREWVNAIAVATVRDPSIQVRATTDRTTSRYITEHRLPNPDRRRRGAH